ncbi:MAG: hypothetical protein ACE5IJ_11310 [Thermoplasmata archaeon]
MRVCMNVTCSKSLREEEFEGGEEEPCPECDQTNTAPAWIKDYRLPGERETRRRLLALKEVLDG